MDKDVVKKYIAGLAIAGSLGVVVLTGTQTKETPTPIPTITPEASPLGAVEQPPATRERILVR